MEVMLSTPQPCRFKNGVCLWVPGTLKNGSPTRQEKDVSRSGDGRGPFCQSMATPREQIDLIILNTAIDFFFLLNKHTKEIVTGICF